MAARAKLPTIFPKPRSLFLHGGFFAFPCVKSEAPAKSPRLLAEEYFFGSGFNPCIDKAMKPQEFSIVIDREKGAEIRCGISAVSYAAQVCRQIAAQCTEDGIPCLSLEDWPDFSVRGFMLDISRGRVPKMAELFALVDMLSKLRFNQLQLYVEHTFAFREHEKVWREASPLMPEEIRALDARCIEKGIELVPNLNSFGHVERWLKYPEYKHLAECPDGFYHSLFKMNRAAGTFKACPETADFMGNLYREYLPEFTSSQFNIGGDEPWELGLGCSRTLCETKGKHAVYLEHMARLQKHATACGKRIQFWADVLLEKDAKNDSPCGDDTMSGFDLKSSIPMIWGYEKGHPFDSQCKQVAERCREFCVVPGTSAWLTLTGRLDNALANISEACAAGLKHGATGVLLTTWGDYGYHNTFAFNLLPLFACAAQSWNFIGNQSPDMLAAADLLGIPHGLAVGLFYAGRLESFFTKKIPNRGIIREMFFSKRSAFATLMEGVPAGEVVAAKSETERIIKMLAGTCGEEKCSDTALRQELDLALEMSKLALQRAEAFLKNDEVAQANAESEISCTATEHFAKVWKLRDRDGGLTESLTYFNVRD